MAQVTVMNRKFLALAFVLAIASISEAGPFGLVRGRSNSSNSGTGSAAGSTGTVYYDNGELSSAQGVANRMARLLRIGHFGNPQGGYEGVGSGATPQQAEWNCCYRRQMAPRDVGYAHGANGLWYCCCRY